MTTVAVGVSVSVGPGVGVMGVMRMISGVRVAVKTLAGVTLRMIGVGVTIPGVRDGMGVHTGKGCGWTFQMSQEVRRKILDIKTSAFFISTLYTRGLRWSPKLITIAHYRLLLQFPSNTLCFHSARVQMSLRRPAGFALSGARPVNLPRHTLT